MYEHSCSVLNEERYCPLLSVMKFLDTKNRLKLLPVPTPAGKGATKHLIKTPVILGKQRGSSFESDWDVFVGTATVFGGGDICRFVSQVSGGCSHLNGSVLYAPSSLARTVSELRFCSLWIAALALHRTPAPRIIAERKGNVKFLPGEKWACQSGRPDKRRN